MNKKQLKTVAVLSAVIVVAVATVEYSHLNQPPFTTPYQPEEVLSIKKPVLPSESVPATSTSDTDRTLTEPIITQTDTPKPDTAPETVLPVTLPQETTPKGTYPLHTNITATIFWVGEPKGSGSSEDNALSAWDDAWETHYGGFDDPFQRRGYYPHDFIPKENPFYFDLPYNDFDWDTGNGRRADALSVIPWAHERTWGTDESILKNRWLQITHNGVTCYGQWEDAGPYVYDDAEYVFGHNDARPKNRDANNAGMDISPALRDCLKFDGLNNDTNTVDWRFVDAVDVPNGPWKDIVTVSQTYWN